MPVMDLGRPFLGLNPPDALRVYSYMAHPNPADEKHREEYFSVRLIDAMRKSRKLHHHDLNINDVPFCFLEALRRAPNEEGVTDRVKQSRAFVAGDILRAIVRDVGQGKPGSINKAKQELVRAYSKSPTRRGFSEKNVRDAWANYKTVSHLWATSYLTDPQQKPIGLEALYGDVKLFLSRAEMFRRFAITYKSRGQENPLLNDKETWKAPADYGLDLVNVHFHSDDKNNKRIAELLNSA